MANLGGPLLASWLLVASMYSLSPRVRTMFSRPAYNNDKDGPGIGPGFDCRVLTVRLSCLLACLLTNVREYEGCCMHAPLESPALLGKASARLHSFASLSAISLGVLSTLRFKNFKLTPPTRYRV
jgi:hypothetical protein